MRFRRSGGYQVLQCAFFLLALLLLREGIAWLRADVAVFGEQASRIEAYRLEPAALFYTEVPIALRAERDTRQRLREGQ